MADDRPGREPTGLLGALLTPLRAPQRVFTDIESIAVALLSLQRDASERLASIDKNAATLTGAVGDLQAPLERIDHKTTELQNLEEAVTVRMDALREDLGALTKLENAITVRMDAMREDLGALTQLEASITERMDGLREDLNARMQAVEHEVHSMRAPMEQISRDVAQVVKLLPEPGADDHSSCGSCAARNSISLAMPSNCSGSELTATPMPPVRLRRCVAWMPTVRKLSSFASSSTTSGTKTVSVKVRRCETRSSTTLTSRPRALSNALMSSPAKRCLPIGPA